MWAKRIGAILAAAILIFGALLLRQVFDGDSGGGGSSTSDPPGATTVVCIPELEKACRALVAADRNLQLKFEPAGTTYERVAADPASAPAAWVTLSPWPQMVSRALAVSGGADPFPTVAAVAATDLVMVGRNARMQALMGHCGGPVTWRCVGDAAGQRWPDLGGQTAWGVLKPSHADAAQSAVGLLAFSTIVSDYWGSTDYTGTDLQNDDAFLSWIGRFEGAVPTYGDAVNTPLSILLAQPRIDVVGTTLAEVDEKAGAELNDLAVSAPNAPAEMVVAGNKADEIAQGLLGVVPSLKGWKAPASGAPGVPSGTGLPSPDVMIALRDLWQGVAKR